MRGASTTGIWVVAGAAVALALGCQPWGEADDVGAPIAAGGDAAGQVVADPEPVPKAPGDPGSACRCDGDCLAVDGH